MNNEEIQKYGETKEHWWGKAISDEDLKSSDIPTGNIKWYSEIIPFASTFDGVKYREENEQYLAPIEKEFEKDKGDLSRFKLSGLRCALYGQWRGQTWDGTLPDDWRIKYAKALIEAIRKKVIKNEDV